MKMSEIVNNFGESLVTGALVMLICVALLSLWSNIRALVYGHRVIVTTLVYTSV